MSSIVFSLNNENNAISKIQPLTEHPNKETCSNPKLPLLMKRKLPYGTELLLLFFLILSSFTLSAQAIVINAPTAADNPNLSGNSPWTAICAGAGGLTNTMQI